MQNSEQVTINVFLLLFLKEEGGGGKRAVVCGPVQGLFVSSFCSWVRWAMPRPLKSRQAARQAGMHYRDITVRVRRE